MTADELTLLLLLYNGCYRNFACKPLVEVEGSEQRESFLAFELFSQPTSMVIVQRWTDLRIAVEPVLMSHSCIPCPIRPLHQPDTSRGVAEVLTTDFFVIQGSSNDMLPPGAHTKVGTECQ